MKTAARIVSALLLVGLVAAGAAADGGPPIALHVFPDHLRLTRGVYANLGIDVTRIDPGFIDGLDTWVGQADGTPLPAATGISSSVGHVCPGCTRTMIHVHVEPWAELGTGQYFVVAKVRDE